MADRRKAKLVHVESLVYGTPLAISRSRLDVIVDALEKREAGIEAAETTLRADRSEEPTITANGIAVLPVMGTFVKRAGMMDALSGLTSYGAFVDSLNGLADNPGVRAILLQGDTPGGQVNGMFEAAAAVLAARKKKPVWAIADEQALSAGYLILSAAERLFVPSTGWVGSIGTIAARRDETEAAEKEGRRTIFVTSGEQKIDGHPETKPTDKEIARLQAKVDQMGQLFFEAVAKHRGMTVEAVAALDAGTFIGAEAVRAGLADDFRRLRVSPTEENRSDATATLEEVVAALTAKATGRAAIAAQAPTTNDKPARRTPMAEDTTGVVANIADHPDFKATMADAEASAIDRADEVTTLCVLAGHPEKIVEYLKAKTPIAEIRAWATAQRAADRASAGVNGLHPAMAITDAKLPPKPERKSDGALYSEREAILAQARG